MRFGTDGIRGHADHDLTDALASGVGRAAARVIGPSADHRAVIGADPRESSARLVAAVADGLASAGVHVVDLGIVPTPVVAFEAARTGALGVMVSASHNPFHDNGIKVFGPGGHKLSDRDQQAIEAALATDVTATDATRASVNAEAADDVAERYRAHVTGVVGEDALSGLHIVLDAAHGAGATLGPAVLASLGAHVTTIGVAPTGRNINDGVGATAPGALAAAVVEAGADLGLALDGDADRLIAVDHSGAIIDGDHVLCILACDMAARGVLADNTVVVTVMSNLGLHQAMAAAGLSVVTTPVGDRAVAAAMEEHGASLGGEQSGHVILADHATTGDGILTGAVLAAAVARQGRSLAELATVMTALPQVLVNVASPGRAGEIPAEVTREAERVEAELGDTGRVLVRPSGTEPLLRIMVEAPTVAGAEAAAARIADAVGRHRTADT